MTEKDKGGHPETRSYFRPSRTSNHYNSPFFLRKARGQKEEGKRPTQKKKKKIKREPKHGCQQRRRGSNTRKKKRGFQGPRPSQKGVNCTDRRSRRTRAATPAVTCTAFSSFQKRQSAPILPFLCKARGTKTNHKGMLKHGTSFPSPVPLEKRGELQGTTTEKD